MFNNNNTSTIIHTRMNFYRIVQLHLVYPLWLCGSVAIICLLKWLWSMAHFIQQGLHFQRQNLIVATFIQQGAFMSCKGQLCGWPLSSNWSFWIKSEGTLSSDMFFSVWGGIFVSGLFHPTSVPWRSNGSWPHLPNSGFQDSSWPQSSKCLT